MIGAPLPPIQVLSRPEPVPQKDESGVESLSKKNQLVVSQVTEPVVVSQPSESEMQLIVHQATEQVEVSQAKAIESEKQVAASSLELERAKAPFRPAMGFFPFLALVIIIIIVLLQILLEKVLEKITGRRQA